MIMLLLREYGENQLVLKILLANFVELSNELDIGLGTNLMIVNPDADNDAYVEDVFKINQLNCFEWSSS